MAYVPHDGWPSIIGLDLSKQDFHGCQLSGEGYTKRKNFKGKMTMEGKEGFSSLLTIIRTGDLVLMEAGTSTFNLARYLMKHTEAEIVVLNPSKLRIIWDSQKKNDKADAMKLACIGRDMRREVWPVVSVPSEEEQGERAVVNEHVALKKEQTAKYNRFFALFNSIGYPDIDKAKCKEDPEYRHSLVDNLLTGVNRRIGYRLLNRLDELDLELEECEQDMIDICLDHPQQAISWLSIPGIGLVNAATLIAYINDGSRFNNAGQLLNYIGLVPKQDQSGNVDVHGRITKKGSRVVRRNIVQGACALIVNGAFRQDCPLSRFAYRKKKELGIFGKASVAVAAKMLKIGLYLLRNNDIYCTAKEDDTALRQKLSRYKLSALTAYLPQ